MRKFCSQFTWLLIFTTGIIKCDALFMITYDLHSSIFGSSCTPILSLKILSLFYCVLDSWFSNSFCIETKNSVKLRSSKFTAHHVIPANQSERSFFKSEGLFLSETLRRLNHLFEYENGRSNQEAIVDQRRLIATHSLRTAVLDDRATVFAMISNNGSYKSQRL